MKTLRTIDFTDGDEYVVTGEEISSDGDVLGTYELRVPKGAVDPSIVGRGAADDLKIALEKVAQRLASFKARK